MLSELAFHFVLCLFIMTVTISAVFDVVIAELLTVRVFRARDTVFVAGRAVWQHFKRLRRLQNAGSLSLTDAESHPRRFEHSVTIKIWYSYNPLSLQC